MSRPHYPEGYGAGHSNYASDYSDYYYEDSDYHHGQNYHPDYQYDYSQDPAYYQDPSLNYHGDGDYHDYRQPSRLPRPAHPSSARERTHVPSAMNLPQGANQQHFHPSHAQSSAWDSSQNEHNMPEEWPLASPPLQAPATLSPQTLRTPPRRPQRPDDQRRHVAPSHTPSQAGPHASPINRQYYQGGPNPHHGNGHWNGESYSYAPPPSYPPPSRPSPHANGPQAMSGHYSTPQAPRQVVYGQANQRPPLGPPPSARRGTSSFYPQVGPVHPIVEETDSMRSSVRTGSFRGTGSHLSGHDSKVSVASSNAIPIGFEAPRIRRPDLASSSEDSFVESPIEPALGPGRMQEAVDQPNRDSTSPEIMLIRQASLGRKRRPTLTNVKSSERKVSSSDVDPAALPVLPRSSMSEIERARTNAKNKLEGQTQPGASDVDREAGQNAVPASAIEEDVGNGPKAEASDGIPPTAAKPFRTPSSGNTPPRNGVVRKPSKEFAALSHELNPTRSIARSPLAPAVDPRVEGILRSLEKGGAISEKEAEELKAPTGGMSGRKRPPRLDVDAVRVAEARGSLSSLPELIRRATRLASNLDRGRTASRLGMNWIDGARDDEKRRSVRSSGMSVYPAGDVRSPDGRAEKGASFGRWSRMMRHSSLGSDSDAGQRRPKRTCCGMPVWLFVLLLILLLMLVAAAVVVPVLLVVVLPNQENNGSNASASASSLGQCEQKVTCDNGGTNILSANGFCECLCVNGYTGTSCQTYSATGCTTTSIGSVTNATVGDAIPRLLEDANGNFSIPLDAQSVLGLFSSSDSSCSTQNALVTFNGKSSRRDLARGVVTPGLRRRQGATSTSSSATSTIGAGEQLDFARIVVLYVLQVSSQIDHAATAQENLQAFFQKGPTDSGSTADARNISLGNDITCNFDNLSLNLANGTSVGGSV